MTDNKDMTEKRVPEAGGIDYTNHYSDDITDDFDFDGGAAVAYTPQAEEAAQPDQEAETEIPESTATFDVDINDMEWEVESEPAEPEVEQTPVYDTPRREYGWSNKYRRHDTYRNTPRYARAINKHLFTWLFSYAFGMFGADRFARGQLGLGVLKAMTFGGFGFWFLYDLIVSIIKSYVGPNREYDDIYFDAWGNYTY